MSKDFYVYVYAYPDGRVFYVGKGTGKRIENHEHEARNGKSSEKCAIIRSIWEQGGQVLKKKLYQHLSEEDALAIEAVLITLFDRANLANGQGGRTRVLALPARKPVKKREPKIIGYRHYQYEHDGRYFEDSIPIYEAVNG